MMEIERDSPSGIDVGAHFLVDAITSASIAAGTAVDNVFTEIRNEAGLRVRKRWAAQRSARSRYKYSAESDYWSHGIGASFGHAALGRHGDGPALARAELRHDVGERAARRIAAGHRPTAFCRSNVWFGGVSYTQVLSPVAIAQVSPRSPTWTASRETSTAGPQPMRLRGPARAPAAQRHHAAHRVLLPADRDRPAAPLPLLLRLLPGRRRDAVRSVAAHARTRSRRASISS